ncbi:MAG: hypothetical protein GY847_29200 [Proteobacteria bacterium]|nr:hypothetical protein [Pseudomonadota bacterium]
MTRRQELEKQGWEKRNTYDDPRLSEIAEMYEEMDFEVHLEPFDPEEETECSECMKVDPKQYKTIYTRRKEDP